MPLLDRCAEKQVLHELLDSVRAGKSRALILRGEPGVGKYALLGYAEEHAADLHVVRIVAVETEKTLSFAAVHQLLAPFLPGMDLPPSPRLGRVLVAAPGATGGA